MQRPIDDYSLWERISCPWKICAQQEGKTPEQIERRESWNWLLNIAGLGLPIIVNLGIELASPLNGRVTHESPPRESPPPPPVASTSCTLPPRSILGYDPDVVEAARARMREAGLDNVAIALIERELDRKDPE